MTADLAAPPQTRPPHINPHWWYRATWHARQTALHAHHARIAQLRANVEAARHAHEALYRPGKLDNAQPLTTETLDTAAIIETIESMLDWTDDVDMICRELGKTAGALEMRLRRAGRVDLSRVFQHARNVQRYKPCPDCGRNIAHSSTRCRPCAFRALEGKVA